MRTNRDYLCLVLPFPPTTNNLFAGKARRFPSRAYRDWQAEAYSALLRQMPCRHFVGPVTMILALGKPDRRRRDVSNYIKAVEDFIVKPAGILSDDEQVQDVRAYWCPEVVGCRVEIEAMT